MTSLHPGETHAAAAPGGRDRRPLLVGCVAAALSFAGSWVPSLWTDEAATITAARRTLPQLWRMLGTVDAVHGAYYAFAHVWVALFGSTALALRLPSAVAVGLAAGALTVLVRRLGGTPALATGSGLVFAVLPRTTWMGVEGRSYAWTALLAVALTLTLVIAADAQGRRRTAPWVAYAVLGALCVVVHIYLVLLLLAHAVSVLPGAGRAVAARFAAAAGGAVVLASPAVVVAAGERGQLGGQGLGPARLLRNLLVNQVFLGDTPTPGTAPAASLSVHGPGDLWQPAAVLLAVVALGVAGWGLVAAARGGPVAPGLTPLAARRSIIRYVLPWLVLPPVLVGVVALVGPPLYNPRYFSFGAPAAAVLVALGLERLGGRRAAAVAVALLVLVAPVYLSQRGPTAKSGTDWAQAADYVRTHAGPGDGVYFAPRYPAGADGSTDSGTDGAEGADDGAGEAAPDPSGVSGTTPVGRTLRSIRDAYPDAFTGLRDVTELTTPADAGTLVGTSAPLSAVAARLSGLAGVWVVRRDDYPAAEAAREDAFLGAQALHAVRSWRGPATEVVEFRR